MTEASFSHLPQNISRYTAAFFRTFFSPVTSRIIRRQLSPKIFFKSPSAYPRFSRTAMKTGIFETSSSPFAVPAMPSKSLPIPTWSIPAMFTAWSKSSAMSSLLPPLCSLPEQFVCQPFKRTRETVARFV